MHHENVAHTKAGTARNSALSNVKHATSCSLLPKKNTKQTRTDASRLCVTGMIWDAPARGTAAAQCSDDLCCEDWRESKRCGPALSSSELGENMHPLPGA